MKKTCLFHKTLPALALALTLGACGGGGGGDDSSPGGSDPGSGGGGTQTASLVGCFTASSTVSFAVTGINIPSGQVAPTQSTTGPMTYNGQSVTGQTLAYSGATISKLTDYWTVTSSSVTLIAEVVTSIDGRLTTTAINMTLPGNMSPGQTVGTATLVGFENITLAGKTFANTCHVKNGATNTDTWYAPGYGMVKQTASGATYQYNGMGSGGTQTASITECYAATQTVRYALTTLNPKPSLVYVYQATVGPATYKGQSAVGQTWFYPAGAATRPTGVPLNSQTIYWAVTSSGVTGLGGLYDDGSIIDVAPTYFYPSNMSPGQTVIQQSTLHDTLIGFETITLVGKTFTNTCHIKQVDSQGNFVQEFWQAPGYGAIKVIYPDGTIEQYNGNS